MTRRAAPGAWGAAALGIALATWSASVQAAPAPLFQWRTISTDWCEVYFHLEAEDAGRRVAAICDESVHITSALIGDAPLETIHVVVADTEDRANGLTRTVPYNLVILYAISPSTNSELSHTEDHLRLVLVHEMLHVVHLDRFSGLSKVANSIFGKFWPPNVIQPRWVVEGLATYVESRTTNGGRLRTDRFRAQLRLAALAGDLWALDDLSNISRRPPGGNAAYMYGAHFLAWMLHKQGPGFIARLAGEYGSHPIPFGVQRSFRDAGFGDVSITQLYEEWRAEVTQQAREVQRLVKARGGPHRARRITRLGGVHAPAFDDDGVLWFAGSPPNGETGLFRMRGLPGAVPELEPVLRTNAGSSLALLEDGGVAWTQRERYRGRLPYTDLFVYRPGQAPHQVTGGLRVRMPTSLPDGRRVVAAARTGVDSTLVVVDMQTEQVHEILKEIGGTQIYSPRPSPDGQQVVYSKLTPGGARDLWEVDLKTGKERRITEAASDDADPTYSPDGRFVIFSSDRVGAIFNLFAVERATGLVTQLTDTLGSATAPVVTPDGRAIVYRDVTISGTDLFITSLDVLPAGSSAELPAITSGTGIGRRIKAPPPGPPNVPFARHPGDARAYNPIWTLAPRTWTPMASPGASGAMAYGVALLGEDAVGLLNWSATATYDTGFGRPTIVGRASLTNLFTPVTLTGEMRTIESILRVGQHGDTTTRRETFMRGSASVSIPLRRWARSQSFSFGYSRQLFLDETGVDAPPDGPAPAFPAPRNIGALFGAWSYSDTERRRDDVSSSDGQALTLRWRLSNAYTLSELNLMELSFDARVFRPVPLMPRHVVGIYVQGGYAAGARNRRVNYRVGGLANRDPLADLISQARFGSGLLRGYPANVDVGDGYTLITVEYRFPLLELEHGIESLPMQLGRLYGVAFIDAGDAFDVAPGVEDFKTSIGAELRLRVLLAYYGFFIVRMGYARGLNPRGVHQPYLVLGVPY